MRNRKIKTFESFSLGTYAIGALTFSIVRQLILWWVENSKDKFDKKQLLSILKDRTYTKSVYGWDIKEEGDTITIYRKDRFGSPDGTNGPIYTTKRGPEFKIHKSEGRVEYISKSLPLDKKLPKKEIDKLVDGIEFTKELSEELEDFQYIIEDEGFEFKISNFDFYKKSFEIGIYKNKNLEKFDPSEIIDNISEVVNRLKSMYGLELMKLDDINDRWDRYKPGFLCIDGFYYHDPHWDYEEAETSFVSSGVAEIPDLRLEKDLNKLDGIEVGYITIGFRKI